MDQSIDGVLEDAKVVGAVKDFFPESISMTQLEESSQDQTTGKQDVAQAQSSVDNSTPISSPRPRDLTSARILGRSSSLKTHRTHVQHAVETRAHAQTAASFKSGQTATTHQRPATSDAHAVPLNTTFGSTARPDNVEKPLTQNLANKQQPPTSATSSPGLFTPVTSPFRPDFERAEASEPLSSPFLHHTHRQAPKETHLAEVDVDPVSGRKIVNHYEIISELGRGVHGKVKLGRDLHTGNYVAIKIVDRISKRKRLGRTGDQETKIKREIAILKKARHPNIVGLLEVIDDPLKKKVYIILEHAELGEVEWRIRGEPEVCFVEYRRNQRESDGVFDNEEEDRYDQHIMETAHRQLEREERREWEEAQDRPRNGRAGDIGLWSLEHGNESDAEPQSPLRGRYAPDANPLRADTVQNDPQESAQPVSTPPPSIPPSSILPIARNATQRQQFDALSTAEVQASLNEDFGGNIYGTYETHSPQDHPGSAFDSFASSRQEYLADHVPEHYSYVPTMSLSEIRRAIRDTMLGLEYLHYQGVVHRDIKPANLLQTRDHRVKISDFGVSYLGKATGDHMDDPSDTEDQDFDEALELAKTVGTPAFYAPELCRLDMDEENPAPVTNQIDIWAVGVTLYCLVFGRVPFHHDNTFALMRLIAEKDVYIPSRRLQAVDVPREPHELIASPQSQIRQSSDRNKRSPHDLVYEEVSEELRDLLKRLLTKDPRTRIKLTEVKTHPWLLTDIPDPVKWLDESDPTTLTQGKPIEISQEDVDVAVVPYGIGERAKSIAYRVKRKVVDVLGYGKGTSRRRAKSSAAGTGRSSNASSSSTISQESKRQGERRQSAHPDEQWGVSSKEADHPLSRSVTASPEPEKDADDSLQEFAPVRPDVLERGVSATGSVRTIRQRDIAYLSNSGAATAPAFPSTPSLLERPPHSSDGILSSPSGHPSAHFKNSHGSKAYHAKISHFLRLGHEQTHSRPSIAISEAVAAGVVQPPPARREVVGPSGSGPQISASSRAPSVANDYAVKHESEQHEAVTRSSSLSSVGSRGRGGLPAGYHSRQMHPHSAGTSSPATSPAARKTSQPQLDHDVIARAKEEQLRRLIQEERQHQASASSAPSPISLAPCPPSPDDLDFEDYLAPSLTEAANVTVGISTDLEGETNAHLNESDSDEQYPPGMSQSTSNPSIPSAVSVNSSIGNDEMARISGQTAHKASTWPHRHPQQRPLQEGPLIVGQDEDYSSGEDFLEMSSHKKSQSSARRGRIAQQSSTAAQGPRQTLEISPGRVIGPQDPQP